MKKLILFLLVLTSLSACKNDPISFPDYKYSAVYFPYQYPVRVITLGEDIYDNSLDLQHKCAIYATIAGVYDNKSDVTINFNVADTICNGYNLISASMANYNKPTDPVTAITAMPHDYYTLASNQIVIKTGDISGGVEVQLTDKFFADPLAMTNHYVIPLQMTTATNVDSILHGKPILANSHPRMLFARKWDVISKDYVLYAVKYINPWTGFYLRRGIDIQTGAVNKTTIRHPLDITTYDAATTPIATWLYYLTTGSMNVLKFPLVLKDAGGNNYTCNLNITFDASGNCTVTSADPATYTATGTGKFVKKGEKNSFGNIDRDVLYLDYTVNHIALGITTQTKDTLLMRNRGVIKEVFTVAAQ
jgi:hypothetical protein